MGRWSCFITRRMQQEIKTTPWQDAGRGLLSATMVGAGIGHFTFARVPFQAQVPDWVPLGKDTVVLLSGAVEIGLGLSLLLAKRQRQTMGLGLAAFFGMVFPGNVHQYTHHLDAFGLNSDTKRLARLFFQPVLMGWALWSTGAGQALRQRLR